MSFPRTKLVQCHLCALQDLCPDSQVHESYKRSLHLTRQNAPANYDLQRIKQATNNCPLKKKVLG